MTFKVGHRPAAGLKTRPLFKLMVERKASDLFFTSNAPDQDQDRGPDPRRSTSRCCRRDAVRAAAFGLMTPEQIEYFQRELEIDFAISEPGLGRFRVAIFYQRGYPGDGAALHHRRHAAARPARPAGAADRPGHAQARPDPDGRRHRLGQVDHAGGDDQLPQRELLPTTSSPSRIRSSSCTPTSARSSTSAKSGSTPRATPARCAA